MTIKNRKETGDLHDCFEWSEGGSFTSALSTLTLVGGELAVAVAWPVAAWPANTDTHVEVQVPQLS